MRTGKPCSTGSGSPFMPRASIAVRPSVTASTGVPVVKPSTLVDAICWAPARTPASASRSASGTPRNTAFETSAPPTSLDTHVMVIGASTRRRARRSS